MRIIFKKLLIVFFVFLKIITKIILNRFTSKKWVAILIKPLHKLFLNYKYNSMLHLKIYGNLQRKFCIYFLSGIESVVSQFNL